MTNGRRMMRVAVGQLGPIQLAETRESAVSRMMVLLEQAAGAGCKLIVFPELALTTFFPRHLFETDPEIDSFCEASMPGPATQPLFDRAKALGIGFYLGYAELTEAAGKKLRFNTSILVAPDGTIVGKYRKVHLPGHSEYRPGKRNQLEKRYFTVGDLGFPVWRSQNAVMGMCICNDRRWPETFRVMGLKGLELLLVGYNTSAVNNATEEPGHLRMFHHLLALQAGAYQNGTWVAAAAKAGVEDGQGLIGGSCIVAPTGEIVAKASTEGDELIMADCDLSLCDYIKSTIFNFEAHRRIEHYGIITSQTGATKTV